MTKPATEIQCPACGYYCLGKGGFGCIDKPTLVALEADTQGTDLPSEDLKPASGDSEAPSGLPAGEKGRL